MKRAILVLVGLTVFGGCTRQNKPPQVQEPSYKGQKLSVWLYDSIMDENGDYSLTPPAKEALLNLGTNALPWLVSESQCPDTTDMFGPHRATERHRVALLAIDLLGQQGMVNPVADIPAVFKVLDNYNDARYAAIESLAKAGPRAVPALLVGLKHPDEETREMCAEALGELQPAATNAVAGLVAALDDPVSEVRASAATALGNIQAQPESVVPALVKTFHSASALFTSPPPKPVVVISTDRKPKVAMVKQGGVLGADVKARVVSVHQGAMAISPHERSMRLWTLQEAVVDALGRYGTSANAALPEFEAYLKQPRPSEAEEAQRDSVIRNAIKDAIWRINPQTSAVKSNSIPATGIR